MQYYSTAEVALILGGDHPLQQVTIQKLCVRGGFPHARRHGRAWMIPECDLTPQMFARYKDGARPKGGRPRGSHQRAEEAA